MKKRLTIAVLAVIFLAVSLSGILDAMTWPSEEAALIRNFGSNLNGSPVLGMVFSGGTEILAVESGEVIFRRSKNDTLSRLPSPLGAWTAVDHGDGLISIYSRYDDTDSIDRNIQITNVSKSLPIAFSGISGWSQQEGFYFHIFDRRDRHWINPSMIITPVQRRRPVQILSVELRDTREQIVRSRNLTQGRYTILVNAISPALPPAVSGNNLAPQRIECLVNGTEVGVLNFEAFSSRDGILMLYRNGLVPVKKVFSPYPAYEAADVFLSRGQANLEVIVKDIAGNSTSYNSRLVIN